MHGQSTARYWADILIQQKSSPAQVLMREIHLTQPEQWCEQSGLSWVTAATLSGGMWSVSSSVSPSFVKYSFVALSLLAPLCKTEKVACRIQKPPLEGAITQVI